MPASELWVLTRDFPPYRGGGVRRASALAERLTRMGFSVSTLSSTGAPSATYPALASRLRKASGRAHLGWLYKALLRFSPLPDEHTLDWPGIAFCAQTLPKPDLILATAPPFSLFFAADFLARVHACPWVADFRDPWTTYPGFAPATQFHREWSRRLEDFAIARARGIMTATRLMGRDLALRAPKGKPIHVFLNGYDPAMFAPMPEHVPHDPPIVGFYGSFYGQVTPEPLVRAVARAGAILEHAGSDFDGQLAACSRRYGSNLRSLGLVDGASAVRLMQRADVLGLIFPTTPDWDYTRSQKLAEYLASGRPILAIVPPRGEAADLIRERDAGLVVSESDAEAGAAAIHTLARRPNRTAATLDLSWDIQAEGAAEFLRTLVSEGRS